MNQRINKLKTLTVWTFFKWLGIALLLFYVSRATAISIARDFLGTNINFSITLYHNSDGLFRPVVEAK